MARFSQSGQESFFLPHGGRLTKAYHCFPNAPHPFVDLSTGINPYSYPSSLEMIDLAALPQPEEEEKLRQAAAHAYGVDLKETGVALSPGAQMLISLLPVILDSKGLVVVEPTYQEYANAWQQWAKPVQKCSTIEQAATLLACKTHMTFIVCNPNNPDGRVYSQSEIEACLALAQERNSMIVIDESFADFETCSLSRLLPHPALMIVRSFGKAYGLAGIRLGFALTSPKLAQQITALMGPWAINAVALKIASQALRDDQWHAQMKRHLKHAHARLRTLLARHRFEVAPSSLLFQLAVREDATRWWRHLAEHGLLVRNFTYNPTWLRFGLPREEAVWLRLQQALEDKTICPL